MNKNGEPPREIRAESNERPHAKQEAALARIGSIALANASLGFLFSQVTSLVAETLHTVCEIWKRDGDEALLVASSRPGVESVGELRAGRDSQEVFTMGGSEPVFMADVEAETRFVPSPRGFGEAIASSLSVPIASGGAHAWGALSLHWSEKSAVDSYDVTFLRAVSMTLAQIIERRRVEVELRVRASQQSAIAELGKIAASGSSRNMLDRACELAMDGLSVEYASFLQLSDYGSTLERIAGPRHVHDAAIDLESSHAGLAFLSREAVCVTDFLRDPRFAESPYYVPHGLRAGLALPVMTGGQVFGVLSIETRMEKKFTPGDIEFISSLATLLAESLERDRGRKALIESERRYRSVVEGASEIIFSLSPDGVLLTLNPAFQVITGWPVDDWIGKPFTGLLAPEDRQRVVGIVASMMSEPRSMTRETKLLGRDGQPVLLEVSISPKVARGEVVELYGFARDISEQRRAEAEKDHVTSKLEQANRLSSLGRLAATVAHEFNNVLMGISPFADILRRETLTERGLGAVEQIARSVKRGKRITEDILRFTQPAEPVFNSLEVATWLSGLVLEARSIVGPKYVIDLDLGNDDIAILGDPNQLHQSFVNLLLNARDAMLHGGRISVSACRETPDARFSFGAIRHPERYAHVTIEDRGHGMSRDTLHHIFEPLFTTKRNGTGLGLAVTRQVITMHGGEIFVESAQGVGTRFHLFLPLAQKIDLPAVAPKALHPDHRRWGRVLIVEDERPVSSGLSALLESEGAAVKVVENGREALGAVASMQPDVVILDIGLPDIDGTTVYSELSARYPTLPVVFSSGHGDQAQLEHLLVQPHVSFLLKPYDLETLLRTLDRVTAA